MAAGGSVDPGFGDAGILTISTTNTPVFAAGAIFNFQVGGNTAGSTYDQLLMANQTASVNDVVLNVADVGNYVPPCPRPRSAIA